MEQPLHKPTVTKTNMVKGNAPYYYKGELDGTGHDTDVKVCNKALPLLGVESPLLVFLTVLQQQRCMIPFTKKLSFLHWECTVGHSPLLNVNSQETQPTPQNEWTYQYILPNDMLIGVPEAVRVTSNPGGLLYKDWEIAQATVTQY